MAADALPLAGLVVLDLTVARAGPTCVRHLADWGADVVQILPPETGDDDLLGKRGGADYQNLHRNKRWTTHIDLKSQEGRKVFLALAAKADVLVENMRTPVKHKLGIAWEDVHPINPRLVYGSISGFGQTGPYADRAGVDQIAQGMGGLMSITGEPGRGPMRAGIAISDMASGTVLALGIMMALFERERTGKGRWVHTSLLESQVFMLDFQAARFLAHGEVPEQVGNEHPTIVPTSAFRSADGYVNIAAIAPHQWRILCHALDRQDWLERPQWRSTADRAKDRDAIHAAIAEIIITRPSEHWVELFESAGIPCGPIYGVDQMFSDPQVQHLEIASDVALANGKTRSMIASPLNFDGVAKSLRNGVGPATPAEEVLALLEARSAAAA